MRCVVTRGMRCVAWAATHSEAHCVVHDPGQRGVPCSSTAFRKSTVRLHQGRLRQRRLHHWRLRQRSLHHPLGKHRSPFSRFVDAFNLTSSSRLSWQFVEWCVQEGLLHVDSHLACKRRGTWYHNYVGKWYEQDVIVSTLGGDGKRWRRLCTDTFAGADHRGKWGSFLPLGAEQTLQVLPRKERKTLSPTAMGSNRGRGDEAQKLRHSWHDSLIQQMETGKLTREATWEDISEVMRGVAEEVVGRESKTNDMPCLRACRKGSPVD